MGPSGRRGGGASWRHPARGELELLGRYHHSHQARHQRAWNRVTAGGAAQDNACGAAVRELSSGVQSLAPAAWQMTSALVKLLSMRPPPPAPTPKPTSPCTRTATLRLLLGLFLTSSPAFTLTLSRLSSRTRASVTHPNPPPPTPCLPPTSNLRRTSCRMSSTWLGLGLGFGLGLVGCTRSPASERSGLPRLNLLACSR